MALGVGCYRTYFALHWQMTWENQGVTFNMRYVRR
jgi:hypothetical protein